MKPEPVLLLHVYPMAPLPFQLDLIFCADMLGIPCCSHSVGKGGVAVVAESYEWAASSGSWGCEKAQQIRITGIWEALLLCADPLSFPLPQRLAYECLSQSYDSAKHSPTLVPTATKPDAVQTESLPYTQYLSMIKSQISCAKDIHNALLECSKKIMGKTPTTQGVL